MYLRSFSQVMFQNSPISGLFFFLGVLINSISMAISMFVAVFFANYFAQKLNYSSEDIENGLYGFNASLVGIAFILFFKLTLWSIVLLIFASFLSVIIFEYMKKNIKSFKAFTFPFILTVWVFLFFQGFLGLESASENIETSTFSYSFFDAIFTNFAQVFFQDYYLSGILFAIGIFFSSKRDFFYTLYASLLAIFIAEIFGFLDNEISLGLYGYNAVLVALALINNVNNKKSFLTISFAIICSVFVVKLFFIFNLIALTFPFVLVSWIFLYKTSQD